MLIHSLIASAALLSVHVQDKPATASDEKAVSLARVMKPGEKLTYQVRSRLMVEERGQGLHTFMPSQLDLNYDFTTEVKAAKADGIVEMQYRRPTMTQIEGETYDAPAKTKVEKTNLDFLLTLSPINEILSSKDTPKAAPKTPPKGKQPPKRGKGGWILESPASASAALQGGLLDQFKMEIYRLALFVGNLDTALDLAPKLPYEEVKPGDTWKRTASYTPQKLKGKDGKMAMQRLDYTYTYRGIVESNGKKVHRITGELSMDNDILDFVLQLVQMKKEDAGIKSIRLNFKSHIDFDLDLQTRRTLQAVASSDGGFAFVLTQSPDDPLAEERIKGS
ncbi:MAG TPA: hypothetical protein VEX38_06660, partial [Fimbriimonadaceae bacterium]|nr:hypothetical protein [Fimbriimonadaceae bacterium]